MSRHAELTAPLGQPHDVDHADGRSLDRFDGIELVGFGRRRASQIEDALGFYVQRMHDIVTDQFEAWIPDQMPDVLFGTGEEIVHADDVIAAFDKSVAKMTAQKSGSAGDKN